MAEDGRKMAEVETPHIVAARLKEEIGNKKEEGETASTHMIITITYFIP